MNTADAAQAFLYDRRSLNRRLTTLKWYERRFNRFIAFSEELPTEPEPIEQFLATVVSGEQEESRHGYYRALKALYRFTCRRRRLLNPMDLVDSPVRHKKVMSTLTALELMLSLGQPSSLRDTALLISLADSACRVGEATSLRKQNIYEGYVVVDGKTGQRGAFITDETHRLLLNLIESNNGADYVFLGQRGPLTASGIYRIVSKYLKAAGIAPPKMGPHRLRHAFGKNFILNGCDIRSLQEIMGHTDISTTEMYVELSQEDVQTKHQRFTALRSAHAAVLHRCADCAYWEPALTYFGDPTGQGGCRFAPARNRKGDKLRECDTYEEGKKMVVEVKPQEVKELESLIIFWKDGLAEHRLLMSPSTIYLVEQTIKSLEKLNRIKEGQNESDKRLERK